MSLHRRLCGWCARLCLVADDKEVSAQADVAGTQSQGFECNSEDGSDNSAAGGANHGEVSEVSDAYTSDRDHEQ